MGGITMAMLPKHNDRYPNYDPSKDLTKEQLQRFTQAANSAQHKREEIHEADSSFMQHAKRTALKQVVKPKPDKPNTARYAAWMTVFGAVCLWLMYMFG
ncbi:hypothetical protein V7N88_000375 [Vibrio cholerae]|uniref:hypothetical protein n=1 Tax=Vibrio TaxID=662 RepID=UPI0002C16F04|nr:MULTISPECIES: hypothetical protein [Vibrio]EMP93682.1 hypothetical protein VC87395_000961 [Vibrio paracholerae 87395]MBW5419296.1 hypothetical protein [Vibrio cholerae]MCO7014768.1 hypothetical protein [Vibrio paracholerae]MCO7018064.1 hypothetical protein [Vibrio paracholerae]MCO7028534.1 hypothetical protein [Vibrio paracholerae]